MAAVAKIAVVPFDVPPVPVPIEPLHDYADWQANHPGSPLPADWIDSDFVQDANAVNLLQQRLALIQRDDGALMNNSVGMDQLDPSVIGEMGQIITDAVDDAEAAAAAAQASASAAATSAQAAAASASLIPTPVVPADIGKVPMVAANGHYGLQAIDPSGALVTSVFGRLGAIVAAAGDYSAQLVSYAGTVVAANVKAALDALQANKLDRALGTVATNNDVAAAGATQGTATALLNDMNQVNTAIAGADGVRLPPSNEGSRIVVVNNTAITVKVWPQVGDDIDGQAVNLSYLLSAGTTSEFLCTDPNSWRSNLGGLLGNSNPLPRGAVSPGTSSAAARADHVHPPVSLGDGSQVTGRLAFANAVQVAASTLNGNNTGALGDIRPLTVAQVIAMLAIYTSAAVDALIATCAKLGAINLFTAAQRITPVALTAASVTVPDFALGNYFKANLNANYAVPNPVNAVEGQSGLIVLIQDGTGGRAVTWGANYKWPAGAAPSNTLTANARDVVPYYVNAAAEILCGNITADIR